MFRGFYTAATGMITQQRRTEMLTNNMSNMNTPGFKADQSSVRAFPEMLIQQMNKVPVAPGKSQKLPKLTYVGPLNTGAYLQEITPNFKQGDLNETGMKTDFALYDIYMPVNEDGLSASIFFTVENPDGGVLYTRNGNFTIDEAGYLTSANGFYVLDENGNRIQITDPEFLLRENGFIEQNGLLEARIGIAFTDNPNALTKIGDGLYSVQEGELPDAYGSAAQFTVKQGFIERSNVDPAQTMTELLNAYRTFEANQRILQGYDRTMDRAANEIGKV